MTDNATIVLSSSSTQNGNKHENYSKKLSLCRRQQKSVLLAKAAQLFFRVQADFQSAAHERLFFQSFRLFGLYSY